MKPHYSISRFDDSGKKSPDADPGWRRFRTVRGAREAVKAIRELRCRGYSSVSIYVSREEAE